MKREVIKRLQKADTDLQNIAEILPLFRKNLKVSLIPRY